MLDQSSFVKPFGSLHVAELARLADVTPTTVRYYARVGLLDPGRDPQNSYRCFSAADLRRVTFVRQAQALGLTIRNIKGILKAVDHGEAPCDQVKSLVAQRLVWIRKQIAELRATENRVMDALASWMAMGDEVANPGEYCALIACVELVDHHTAKMSQQRRRTSLQHERRDHVATNGASLGAEA